MSQCHLRHTLLAHDHIASWFSCRIVSCRSPMSITEIALSLPFFVSSATWHSQQKVLILSSVVGGLSYPGLSLHLTGSCSTYLQQQLGLPQTAMCPTCLYPSPPSYPSFALEATLHPPRPQEQWHRCRGSVNVEKDYRFERTSCHNQGIQTACRGCGETDSVAWDVLGGGTVESKECIRMSLKDLPWGIAYDRGDWLVGSLRREYLQWC